MINYCSLSKLFVFHCQSFFIVCISSTLVQRSSKNTAEQSPHGSRFKSWNETTEIRQPVHNNFTQRSLKMSQLRLTIRQNRQQMESENDHLSCPSHIEAFSSLTLAHRSVFFINKGIQWGRTSCRSFVENWCAVHYVSKHVCCVLQHMQTPQFCLYFGVSRLPLGHATRAVR